MRGVTEQSLSQLKSGTQVVPVAERRQALR
jgi:hypothetical protein